MATEMITLKLDRDFLNKVDSIADKHYQNRTEFIRTALREKIEDMDMKNAVLNFMKLKGSSDNKISDELYEKVRATVFDAISRNIK